LWWKKWQWDAGLCTFFFIYKAALREGEAVEVWEASDEAVLLAVSEIVGQ
jgi:hypothetical protein